MLTFNDLLALEHVDVARVRLVRHQDRRLAPGRLYEAWRNDRASFESYQAVQARDVFRVGDLLASFIVTEAGKTVFVGMYSVDGVGTCPDGAVDALLKHDISGQVDYQLQHVDHLSDYVDRVVIDWGAGTRSWVQRAANQPKPVVEIAEQYEPKFPGFRVFTRLVDEVPALPAGWQQVLRSVKGVYLLVDVETGHQYVGSAKGADSLFGRGSPSAAARAEACAPSRSERARSPRSAATSPNAPGIPRPTARGCGWGSGVPASGTTVSTRRCADVPRTPASMDSTCTGSATPRHRWLAAGSESGLMAMASWSRTDMLVRYTRATAAERAAARRCASTSGTSDRPSP